MRSLLALLLIAAPAALAAEPIVEERLYVAEHALYVSTGIFDCEGRAIGIGGVCFLVPPGSSTMALEIVDVTGARVAASAVVAGDCEPATIPREAYCVFPFGPIVERHAAFCEGMVAPLPQDAAAVVVWIRDDWVFDILVPDACGQWPEPETAGVVRATFS